MKQSLLYLLITLSFIGCKTSDEKPAIQFSSSKVEYDETKCRNFINEYSWESPKYNMFLYKGSKEEAYEKDLKNIPQETYIEIIDQIDAIITIFENECGEVQSIMDPILKHEEISTLSANGIMGYQLTQLTEGLVHDADRFHALNKENMKRYHALEKRIETIEDQLYILRSEPGDQKN